MSSTLNVNSYLDLLDATRGVDPGDVIQLDSDITPEAQLVFANSCKLDLGGNKLTLNITEGIRVTKNIELTIENGTIIGLADDIICASGSNSRVVLKSKLVVRANTSILYAEKGGKIIVDGAELISEGTSPAAFATGKNSSIDVISGSITSKGQTVISIKGDATGSVGGNGQVLSECPGDDPDTAYCAVFVSGIHSSFILTGNGVIYSEHTNVLSVAGGSGASIESGCVESKSNTQPAITVQGNGSILRVIGGTIKSVEDAIVCYQTKSDQSNSVEVVGGSIKSNHNIVSEFGEGLHTINLTGGYFDGLLDDRYVPDGYTFENGYIIQKLDDNIEVVDPADTSDDDPMIDTPDIIDGEIDEPVVDCEMVVSYVLKKAEFIRIVPNNPNIGFECIGAIDVFPNYTINYNRVEFTRVRAVRRGTGGRVYGYIQTSVINI